MQLDKSNDTSNSGVNQNEKLDKRFYEHVCSLWCYLRPPALRKFSQKDLLLVLAISSSDVGMSFELNTWDRQRRRMKTGVEASIYTWKKSLLSLYFTHTYATKLWECMLNMGNLYTVMGSIFTCVPQGYKALWRWTCPGLTIWTGTPRWMQHWAGAAAWRP